MAQYVPCFLGSARQLLLDCYPSDLLFFTQSPFNPRPTWGPTINHTMNKLENDNPATEAAGEMELLDQARGEMDVDTDLDEDDPVIDLQGAYTDSPPHCPI